MIKTTLTSSIPKGKRKNNTRVQSEIISSVPVQSPEYMVINSVHPPSHLPLLLEYKPWTIQDPCHDRRSVYNKVNQ